VLIAALPLAIVPLHAARGQQPSAATAPAPADEISRTDARVCDDARRMIEKGAKYLLSTQEESGGWVADRGPGVAALVLKALIQTPGIGAEHPAVKRGVAAVLESQRDDGGIYGADGMLKNYESSVTLSMLGVIPGTSYRAQIDRLQAFLKDLQWDETEGIPPDNPWYGGAGYGMSKRPDLSNTQLMLDALRDSGLSKDDPAYRKALVFVQRCQMIGESNDQPFAKGSTQGGFIYTPANGGESKAMYVEADGRKELRAYGSMSYAGLKSMLYAGLTKDDARVKAVLDWMQRHWTLEQNPNMPEAQAREGLFYYYHTLARALDACGERALTEASGRTRIWRHELVEQLRKMQNDDGSWVNDADRWFEGYPQLTTAYALLALQAACPAGK
jgi:squalene-hopene/tetraprenyl-beta-curcumene cyclase